VSGRLTRWWAWLFCPESTGKVPNVRHADDGEDSQPMPGRTSRRRRDRTHTPLRFGVPALVAAALLGVAVMAGLSVSASADPGGGTDGGTAAELAAQVRAVSDPESPGYRHFYTPAQVAKYLPGGRAGVAQVGQHLMRSQRVSAEDAARLVVGAGQSASSGARAADSAATGPPQPCSAYFGQLAASAYPAAFGAVAPFAVCGYTPAQLRSAYEVDDGTGHGVTVAVLDAYGSTTMPQDANTYAIRHGDKAFAAGQYTQKVDPAAWTLQDVCGGAASWAQEQSLDIEAVHAMAPRAKVLYYGANSCQDSDLLAALTDIVRNRLADVVTASWGSPVHSVYGDESAEAIAQYDRLFQVAALEGITIDYSSGDCGANTPTSRCGGADGLGSTQAQTTFPASDPWVTAVGGTSVAIGKGGGIERQTAWGTRAWEFSAGADTGGTGVGGTGAGGAGSGDAGPGWAAKGWIYGGGGGISADFAEPWYQVGKVPGAVAGTLMTGAPADTPRRAVPDVALDADPFTGMLVGETRRLHDGTSGYAESAVGGTSLASPLLAGLEADAIQLGGRALGFVNPALYEPVHTCLVRDVAAPSQPTSEVFPPIPGKSAVLVLLGDDGPLLATQGYDTATGLGAPGQDFDDRLGGT
jgi:subtilase family serine protease